MIVDHVILIIEKNDFSLLGESLTDDFNGRIGVAEKNISINLKKEKEKNSLDLQYNPDNSYLHACLINFY